MSNIKYQILKYRKNGEGFTLIEILVAIAIIGVVFGIIISSAAAIQRSGRNAQRKADLRTIQTALQQYYADHQYFPSTLGSSIQNADGTKKYLKSVPNDPRGGSYSYSPRKNHSAAAASCTTPGPDPTCQYYKLCIAAELPASDFHSECPANNFGVTPL